MYWDPIGSNKRPKKNRMWRGQTDRQTDIYINIHPVLDIATTDRIDLRADFLKKQNGSIKTFPSLHFRIRPGDLLCQTYLEDQGRNLFSTILDHVGPFWTMVEHFGLFWTIIDHFRPIWATLNNSWQFGQFWIILDNFRQFRIIWRILDNSGIFLTIMNCFGPYWTILDQDGQCWIIWKFFVKFLTNLDQCSPFWTIQNYFELIRIILDHCGQLWITLKKIEKKIIKIGGSFSDLDNSDHLGTFCTILEYFLTNMHLFATFCIFYTMEDLFSPFWTNLGHFRSLWTSWYDLGSFWTILNHFKPFCTT